ncbi:MAG TPA: hypothetical protein VMT85_06610 [Thermoanaerobaculia bacterium]|nr:hypothetical protein [Thermoanaerobaculia bacterium]
MSAAAFDPLRILRALAEHRVAYVLIGALAGRLQGSPTVTNDLDLCYARDRDNLEALTKALRVLGARLRGVPEEVPFQLEARTLEMGDAFTFETSAGNLDILGRPAGADGYESLARTAERLRIEEGLVVQVAALEDLVAMKRAAARPKDLIEVEVLRALIEERDAPSER